MIEKDTAAELENAVHYANKLLASYVPGESITAKSLAKLVQERRFIQEKINYGDTAEHFADLYDLVDWLDLNPEEFARIFGSDIEQILFGCAVEVAPHRPSRLTPIVLQLYNRTKNQLQFAHRLLCLRGMKFDYNIPVNNSSESRLYSIGFSAEIKD